MCFPSYLLDIRRFFPYRYWVSRIAPVPPESAPHILFLFVRLMVCYRLSSSVCYLSDSAESLVPPPIGRTVDFHHINTRALLGAHKKRQLFEKSEKLPKKEIEERKNDPNRQSRRTKEHASGIRGTGRTRVWASYVRSGIPSNWLRPRACHAD